jgi:hypothetical protein
VGVMEYFHNPTDLQESGWGLGRVKTKSDLVVMLSGGAMGARRAHARVMRHTRKTGVGQINSTTYEGKFNDL